MLKYFLLEVVRRCQEEKKDIEGQILSRSGIKAYAADSATWQSESSLMRNKSGKALETVK